MSAHGIKWNTDPSCIIAAPGKVNSHDRKSTESWVKGCQEWLDELLNAGQRTFWSTIAHNSQSSEMFRLICDFLPRPYDEERKRELASDQSHLESIRLLRGSALAVLLRILVYDEKDRMPLEAWRHCIHSLGLVKMVSLGRMLVCWAPPAENSMNIRFLARILKEFAEYETSVFEDAIAAEEEQVQELTEMRMSFDRIQSVWQIGAVMRTAKKTRMTQVVYLLLTSAVEWLYATNSMYRCLREAGIKTRCSTLIAATTRLVEHALKFLKTECVQEIAMLIDYYPMRKLLRLRSLLVSFGVELVHELLSHINDSSRRSEVIVTSILTNERFAFAYHNRYPLLSKLKDKEQEKALQVVIQRQKQVIIEEIEQMGLLQHAGDVIKMSSSVARMISELRDIFPDLSPIYVHLCLRHVDYSVSDATDMIINEKVPEWIGYLKEEVSSSRSPHRKAAPARIPPIPYLHEECSVGLVVPQSNENAVENIKEGQKGAPTDSNNYFKDIFSLNSNVNTSTIQNSDSQRQPSPPLVMEITVEQLRHSLKKLQMEISLHSDRIRDENLVEMKTSKNYPRAEKFYQTAADKISTRPFYEKFKFVSDGIYDDEYDDTYEEKDYGREPTGIEEDSTTNDKGAMESKDTTASDNLAETEYPSDMIRSLRNEDNIDLRGGKDAVRRGPQPQRSNQERCSSERGGSSQPGSMSSRAKSDSRYTGGRERQLNERHKNQHRQRGADRKARGGASGS